jgi:hypothetical protein
MLWNSTDTAYYNFGILKNGSLIQMGEYNNAGDTLAESIFNIEMNGNKVGVGTTTPSHPLTSVVSVASSSPLTDGSNYALAIQNTDSTAGNAVSMAFGHGGYNYTNFISSIRTGTGTDPKGDLTFGGRPSDGATFVERMRISSAGAIGFSGANYGTSGQVLTSGGSGAAPTWADASSGGMTQITSGTIGSNAQYNFSLGSNWWNTYKYVKVIYLATFQSGDPPSGTYHCQFRLNSVSTSIYTYSGQRGSTNSAGTATTGRLTVGSPQDNIPVFIEAEIYTDGTHTFVSASSGGGQSNGGGFANTLVSNQTPTTFNIIQDGFGSERYRFEGTITFYGVN